MEKKLTLDDLKLESFLTELNNSKITQAQGGFGAYDDTEPESGQGTGCDTDNPWDDSGSICITDSYDNWCGDDSDLGCQEPETQTLNSNECDTRE